MITRPTQKNAPIDTSPVTGAVRSQRRTSQIVVSVGVGNAMEWFDWAIYATFAPFFATQLFDSDDPASAVLSTLAVFAVGFLARPLGGLMFGVLSDTVGRKSAMTLAVALAAAGSLLIAVTPTYAAVGVFASIVLLAARLIQGLAHGGEMPSAQTYISEVAPRERRGLWATLIYISGTLGNLFGILLGAVLALVLTNDDMLAWGWRVPFFIGAAFGLFSVFMRMRMHETRVFDKAVRKAATREPLLRQIVRHRRKALQILALTVGGTVNYYVWGISAPTYASTQLGMDRGAALWASLGANIVFLVALPLWGLVSDRVGRKPVLIINAMGCAALFFPMNAILNADPLSLFVAQSVMMIFVAASSSIVPAAFAELFPTEIRTVGVAVPYSIGVALFGGTAPYLQAWMGANLGPHAFSIYAVLLLLITLVAIGTIPETKGIDLSVDARSTPSEH